MNKNRNYSQKGGLGFGDAIKAALLSRHPTGNITDIDIIRLLLSNVNQCQILSDMSTYSFVFKFEMRDYRLINTYGLSLQDTVDMPGLDKKGIQIESFCCKICFVSNTPGALDKYPTKSSVTYEQVTKCSVLPNKALREGHTQDQLWNWGSCRNSRSSFVPYVIAQTILSGEDFTTMFARILLPSTGSPPDFPIVNHNRAVSGVKGSIPDIYNYIITQLAKGIDVHVILMEMIEYNISNSKTEKPLQFVPLHTLKNIRTTHEVQISCCRIAAQLVLVGAAGIATHDTHDFNAMGTLDGSRTIIIDWGGILSMRDRTDIDNLFDIFSEMCKSSLTWSLDETANSKSLFKAIHEPATNQSILMTMFPSLEDLCFFFNIPLKRDVTEIAEDRLKKIIIEQLVREFTEAIDQCYKAISSPPTVKDVHFRLMMIAFIDFMYNRIKLKHPYCQCSEILEVVYPQVEAVIPSVGKPITSSFKEFRSFLTMFNLRNLPIIDNLVVSVVDYIQEYLQPCPSGETIKETQLKANWPQLQKEYRKQLKEYRKQLDAPKSKTRRAPTSRIGDVKAAGVSKQNKPKPPPERVNDDIGDNMTGEPSLPIQSRPIPTLVPPDRGSILSRIVGSRFNPRNWPFFSKKKLGGKHKHKRRHNYKTKRNRKQ